MDVGTELREARERRGLSLLDISQRTKISLSVLRAIENNDVGRLPPLIYTRGFLKMYAHHVGLDPAEISDSYSAQFAPAPDESVSDVDEARTAAAAETPNITELAKAYLLEHARVAAVAVLALVAVSYIAVSRSCDSRSPQRNSHQRNALSVASRDLTFPRTVTSIPGATATTGFVHSNATSPGVLRVELRPRGNCWVSATADRRRVAYRLMHAGERQTIEAQNELILRVGDAGSFGFSINGASGRRLGRPGEPTTTRITRANFEQFLAR